MSSFFSLLFIGLLVWRIARKNNDDSPSIVRQEIPAAPPVEVRASVNFVEDWLKSQQLCYNDDSNDEAFRYSLRISLVTVIVDVRFLLERNDGDFYGCVDFPMLFQDHHFPTIGRYIEAFNESLCGLHLRIDKNSGVVQLQSHVKGSDVADSDESSRRDCMRLILKRADIVFPELVRLAYANTLPEISIIKTLGFRRSAMN